MSAISVTINGNTVEAELGVIQQILLASRPTQATQLAPQPHAPRAFPSDNPDYDGRAPSDQSGRKSAKRTIKNHISAGTLWTDQETRILLTFFPLDRETTPPISAINRMIGELPGRSAPAIQIRWYSLKKGKVKR